jgi:hypothetical protein
MQSADAEELIWRCGGPRVPGAVLLRCGCRYAKELQSCRGAEVQRCRGAMVHRCTGAVVCWCRCRYRCAEV